MMNLRTLAMIGAVSLLFVAPASAELLRVEIKTLGMD